MYTSLLCSIIPLVSLLFAVLVSLHPATFVMFFITLELFTSRRWPNVVVVTRTVAWANQYSTICSAFAGLVQVGRSEAKTAIGSIAMKVCYCAVVRVHSSADAIACTCFRLHVT